jgi:hypothetical protein
MYNTVLCAQGMDGSCGGINIDTHAGVNYFLGAERKCSVVRIKWFLWIN